MSDDNHDDNHDDNRDDFDRELAKLAREHEKQALEREKHELERAKQREAHELERLKQALEREREREAKDLEREREREVKALALAQEREQRDHEREQKRLEREEREYKREHKRLEREAEAFARERERAWRHAGWWRGGHGPDGHGHDPRGPGGGHGPDGHGHDPRVARGGHGPDGHGPDGGPGHDGEHGHEHGHEHGRDGFDPRDPFGRYRAHRYDPFAADGGDGGGSDKPPGPPGDAGPGGDDPDAGHPGAPGHPGDPYSAHWEHHWMRAERALQHRLEKHRRWKHLRDEHRARWRQHKKRWKHLRDERQMWMRAKDQRAWGPWWLQAKMRKRIFIWLTLSFIGGAVGMYYWPVLHWWHSLIALFFLSAVSGAVSVRMTRPLLMVIQVAQDIGDGKLETRLDIEGHRGETRLLAMAINDMAERIEQQLKDQRQLLAAVSHELRTPLGHMRVLIETARNTVATAAATNATANAASKPADCKALAELEREVLVLDDLVGRLLASSRLEFGNLDCRPVDLGELVTDVATSAGVAPEAIEAIGDVHAEVDPTLIRRAVANLLDNARIHGNGAVAVRIERRARQIAIEVDDAGPGVPADRRSDAFRAFVPSRAGGLGLGLALVSRIAVAHNGGAWITDRPGGGARVGFTVEIAPLPPPDEA